MTAVKPFAVVQEGLITVQPDGFVYITRYSVEGTGDDLVRHVEKRLVEVARRLRTERLARLREGKK